MILNFLKKILQTGSQRRAAQRSRGPTFFRPWLEPLEPRTLLAVQVQVDFGDITNPAHLRVVNDQLELDGIQERFLFKLGQSAVLVVVVSDVQLEFSGTVREPDGALEIFNLDGTGPGVSMRFSESTTDEIRVSLPPGNYAADYRRGDASQNRIFDNVDRFDLAIHADTAEGFLSAGSTNLLATAGGRNLGTLATASGVNIQEYVGIRGAGAVDDPIDMYLFDLVKQGTVEVTVDAGVTNDLDIDFTLFRDFDGDGVFERGTAEQIVTATGIEPGNTSVVSPSLPPARYGIAVTPTPSGQPNLEFSQADNYRLRTTYTVADGAGNTLAAANIAGGTNFNDYLSPSDPVDIYRFTTGAGGPFFFEGVLSGMAAGSNFELDFIRDLDGDGVFDENEVIKSSDFTGNANEELSVTFNTGTYFVRVRRTAGEGVYTLVRSTRNTDLAGNTLGTAQNFGTLFGFKEFNDIVSATDPHDVFKFTLDLQSDFRALLEGMPAGTNADLALFRDPNGNGDIDAGDTLATSTNAFNASESIAINLAAGTYFVRVRRVAGAPTYHLRLVKDSVGNTLATGLLISASGGGNLDFLGPEDASDVYRFSLGASPKLVGISVGLNNEPLSVRLGVDRNANGVLEAGELLIDKIIGAGAGELQRINLEPFTAYKLVVSAVIQDVGTTYGVTLFSEKPDFAGNTLALARDIGTLGAVQNFSDFVGDGSIDLMDDLDDFYRFTVGDNGKFSFQANFLTLSANADLQLIRDDNLNQIIDSGELLTTSTGTGAALDTIIEPISVPGIYYLRVFRTSGQVDYALRMKATSTDTAGNSLGAAADLGTLTSTINSANHFVGRIDLNDFFRFSVNSPGELLATLSGAAKSLNIEVLLDSGATLASSAGFIGANDRLNGVFLPRAGAYFVRVLTLATDSTYNLGLTFSNQTPFLGAPFQITPTGATIIQAEAFDNGGEGVAYHDTTAGNTGGSSRANENVDIKTTADIGGGFRTIGTAVGEFLEYTINVTQSSTYDFDFRVASPDPGATFHVEIDGKNVTGSVNMPDTNGIDSMTTVTKAGVPLTSGPHILRFVHDAATSAGTGFAGSLNFLRIRPATTGTFELTPQQSIVAAGAQATLSLQWTVPFGGWRQLKDVQLRLSDEQGIALWIKFDEAANTFSLFNPASGKFGPGKTPGEHGVLSNRYVTIRLLTSSVQADGSTDPSVVLTFDIRFKKRLAGRILMVEAAASDDLGHADEFAFAGTLEISGPGKAKKH